MLIHIPYIAHQIQKLYVIGINMILHKIFMVFVEFQKLGAMHSRGTTTQ